MKTTLRQLSVLILALLQGPATIAEVITDGSVGLGGALPGPDFAITDDLGSIWGSNLFHSFSEFNLANSESATFSGPAAIANILSRVTGGNSSNIDGLMRSTIDGANLYFLNPHGVVFGKNARIDVSGSFVVSTAGYLKLLDGGVFHGLDSSLDVLTTAPPSAFGFSSADVSPITFVGNEIMVADEQSFAAVGGAITIDEAEIKVPGGHVHLTSVASTGEVALDVTDSEAASDDTGDTNGISNYANIDLLNQSMVNVDGAGGGRVVVQGHDVVLEDSTVSAVTNSDVDGKGVAIRASGALDMSGSSVINVTTFGLGRGGEVSINAGSMSLTDGAFINSSTFGLGKGSDVSLQVAQDLLIAKPNASSFTGVFSGTAGSGEGGAISVRAGDIEISGGGLSSVTFGDGEAGAIRAKAETILIVGEDSEFLVTGISSISFSPGKAGELFLDATMLEIRDGGEVSSNTFGDGDAGAVNVEAERVFIERGASEFFTGVFSNALDSSGNSGQVNVDTAELEIRNGGEISANTFSRGDAGVVDIKTGSILISGDEASNDIDKVTGILSEAKSGSSGNGGQVLIQADSIELLDSGQIRSSTFAQGNAGNVGIVADSLLIDGKGNELRAGISSRAWRFSKGNAGAITLQIGDTEIRGGGKIEVASFDEGTVGDITVNADQLKIDGLGTDIETSISSVIDFSSKDKDYDGSIEVRAGVLEVRSGGQIVARSFSEGKSGDIAVYADQLIVDGLGADNSVTSISSQTTIGSNGNGGNVEVSAGEVEIRAGGQITVLTAGNGDAGDVMVKANNLLVDGLDSDVNTGISSQAVLGSMSDGGNVEVRAGALEVRAGGLISATTSGEGNAGDVKVKADQLVIDGLDLDDKTTAITSQAALGSKGNGGNVKVSAGVIEILAGGQIDAITNGEGNAGKVTVEADRLVISSPDYNNTTDVKPTGISTQAGPSSKGNDANGGDVEFSVEVSAREIEIYAFGLIGSSTFGEGNAGNVKVEADRLLMDAGADTDAGVDNAAFIGSSAEEGSKGSGGTVWVQADEIELLDGGTIDSNTFGKGDAGEVKIDTDRLLIDSSNTNVFTGISSISWLEAEGNGGWVQVRADRLDIRSGGRIASGTFTEGNAEDVTVIADRIVIDGSRDDSVAFIGTGIFSSAELNSSGNASSIEISSGEITLTNKGVISSASIGSGVAGSITIDASRDVSLIKEAKITTAVKGGDSSNRASESFIELYAQNLFLDQDSIISTSSTGAVDAGTIEINATDSVKLVGGSSISTTAEIASGGGVNITTGNVVTLENSEITTTAAIDGGKIGINTIESFKMKNSLLSARAGNDGGDITTVDPFLILIDRSEINASAGKEGGNITLVSEVYIKSSDSILDATGAISDGIVDIQSPNVVDDSNLVTLPESLLDANSYLPERCATKLDGNYSSLIAVGRGGVPLAPGGYLPAYQLSGGDWDEEE